MPPPARPEPVLVKGVSARAGCGGTRGGSPSGSTRADKPPEWVTRRVQWGAGRGGRGREVVLGRARSFPQRARRPGVRLRGAEAARVSAASTGLSDRLPMKSHCPCPKGGAVRTDLGTLKVGFSTSGTCGGPQPVVPRPKQIVCPLFSTAGKGLCTF